MLKYVEEEVDRVKGLFEQKEARLVGERDSAKQAAQQLAAELKDRAARAEKLEQQLQHLPGQLEVCTGHNQDAVDANVTTLHLLRLQLFMLVHGLLEVCKRHLSVPFLSCFTHLLLETRGPEPIMVCRILKACMFCVMEMPSCTSICCTASENHQRHWRRLFMLHGSITGWQCYCTYRTHSQLASNVACLSAVQCTGCLFLCGGTPTHWCLQLAGGVHAHQKSLM